jgi:outer membrane protein assembly factor BamE (lipoprotein component of BamABCDE complex)
MKTIGVVVTLLLALSACVTDGQVQSIREGMSKEEVVAILGDPDGFQRAGKVMAKLN